MTLFDHNAKTELNSSAPLATRMRPHTFDEFVGQQEIAGPGRVLRRSIESGHIPSMILWGPPGTGKTHNLINLVDFNELYQWIFC